jgi:Putative adhesin
MKTISRCLLPAAFLAALLSSAHAKIERTVEKSFNVQPGGTLHIQTQGGNIQVQPSNDSVVKVTAKEKITASSETEADEILEKLTLTIEQTGNDITASSKYEQRPAGFRWKSWPPVQVDFIVTMPASFASEVKTSGGNVVLGDFAGKVHARTSGGDVTLGKIGADVDASTSGGNVRLTEGMGTVKLHTSGGNIVVGRATGVTELGTSGGNIRIDSVENTLRASTSGGDVSAGLFGLSKGDCELRTSGGNVTAVLEKTAAFRLDASTSGGRVSAEGLTITLDKAGQSRSQLKGDINGGGPLLKLRSSGGDVSVKTR